LGKNITSLFQDGTEQVKIELHTTTGNGFYIIRFKQFHEEAIDNKVQRIIIYSPASRIRTEMQ